MKKVYEVKNGDTFWGIATAHEVTVDELYWENRKIIKNKNSIFPGQILTIPDGKWTIHDTWQCVKGFFMLLVVTIVALLCFGGIGCVLYKIATYEPPKCRYEYIDTQGNSGVASICKFSWGSLYCGEENTAIQVVEVEKICK